MPKFRYLLLLYGTYIAINYMLTRFCWYQRKNNTPQLSKLMGRYREHGTLHEKHLIQVINSQYQKVLAQHSNLAIRTIARQPKKDSLKARHTVPKSQNMPGKVDSGKSNQKRTKRNLSNDEPTTTNMLAHRRLRRDIENVLSNDNNSEHLTPKVEVEKSAIPQHIPPNYTISLPESTESTTFEKFSYHDSDQESNESLIMLSTTESPRNRRSDVKESATDLPIWFKGSLSPKTFNTIRYYSQLCYLPATLLSIPFAGFSAIINSRCGSLNPKLMPLVVTFNVLELCKSVFYNIFQIWRLILGDQSFSWTSPMMSYIIYVHSWAPEFVRSASVFLNMIICIDRFVKIIFPVKSSGVDVIRRPVLTIAICVSIPALVHINSLILLMVGAADELKDYTMFKSGEVLFKIQLTNPSFFKTYNTFRLISATCFRYIPLFGSLLLSFVMVIVLQRKYSPTTSTPLPHHSESVSNRANLNRMKQTNRMIISSVLIYSLLVGVRPVVQVISLYNPVFGTGKKERFIWALVNQFSQFLDGITPSVNFVFYYKLGSRFRNTVQETFIF